MPRVSIGSDDLARASQSRQPVSKVGWYSVVIADYQEKPKADDKSMNWMFFLKILGGAHSGNQKLAVFNEKNPEYIGPLLMALGAPKNAKGGVDAEWNKEAVVGKQLDVYIAREVDDKNNEVDRVREYRPFTGPNGVYAA